MADKPGRMDDSVRTRPWSGILGALVDGMDEAPGRWRTLAALYLTAAPWAALTLLMPHGRNTADWSIGALAAAATLVGVAPLALAEDLPDRLLGPMLGLGTVMITLA